MFITVKIQMMLEQQGLNRSGPLIHGFFSINMYHTVNILSLPCDFLNNIFFSLSYLIVKTQYIKHITYKIH